MHLNDGRKKINTIEGPGGNIPSKACAQSQVAPTIPLGFASCCAACCGNRPM